MRNIILLLIFCTMSIIALGQDFESKPKMVVAIVVDQMKTEYVSRFYNDFEEGGFKRLMNDGHYFSNMHYNYSPTATGPGHASIFTGCTPSVHGIVGNYWYHPTAKKSVYCVADDSVKVVGEDKSGGMSPHRLLSTTITDELQLSTNFRSKIVGISIKDRGAVLPAGHLSNGAYWMAKNGHFISSTHYMDALPDWVNRFNSKNLALDYLKKPWTTLNDISTYDESLADDNPYESKFTNKETPTFPYDIGAKVGTLGISVIKSTPFGNNILIDFAKEVIVQENFGADDYTDFLSVSFSSTDYVGHSMGPRSIELQDTYLRLDKTIAEFLNYLDEKIGKGNYLLFLTADHAAAEVSTFLSDNGINAGNRAYSALSDDLKSWSMNKYGTNLIESTSNNNIHINDQILGELKLNKREVVVELTEILLQRADVKRVYNNEDLMRGNIADPFLTIIQGGFDPKQSGDLIILPEIGFYEYKNTGTTHGSPYSYDTHVPLFFYGQGISHGRTVSKKVITQIAPTLAQLLNTAIPSGSTVDVLKELFDE